MRYIILTEVYALAWIVLGGYAIYMAYQIIRIGMLIYENAKEATNGEEK